MKAQTSHHTRLSATNSVSRHPALIPKDAWIKDLRKVTKRGGDKSQNAQDAYFEAIFGKIGTTNRYFVEFGFNEPSYTSGGSGANTRNLYDQGWRGLLLDGTMENLDINLHAHYLFQNNIGSLLRKYNTEQEFDLLSCDMDSHDLFVLKGIFEAGFRPRVVTTEFNVNYPLEYAISQIDPTILGAQDISAYDFKFKDCAWGASASALRIVAEKFGYTLIGRVANLDLVWLRNDLISSDWEIPDFEWFFIGASLGDGLHPQQKSTEIYDFLLDFEVFERTGDLYEAKSAARSKLNSSGLHCFKDIAHSNLVSRHPALIP
jgi:hypothetical protein